MNDFEKACDAVDDFTGETMRENAIEFIRDAKVATVNFCQGRYVSRIRDYAVKYPSECQIVSDTPDGIVAHIPTKWIKITRQERKMTEEEKRIATERIRNVVRERNK